MEGLLGVETGSKKPLFSLKHKKKFHCILSGTSLTYTKEGESSPSGTIFFTTDTHVEGSPKGKRLIMIRNKSQEWELICPDPTSYGKWMDQIALVFRSLHVDESKIANMVNSGFEGDAPIDDVQNSSESNDTTISESTSQTSNSNISSPHTSSSSNVSFSLPPKDENGANNSETLSHTDKSSPTVSPYSSGSHLPKGLSSSTLRPIIPKKNASAANAAAAAAAGQSTPPSESPVPSTSTDSNSSTSSSNNYNNYSNISNNSNLNSNNNPTVPGVNPNPPKRSNSPPPHNSSHPPKDPSSNPKAPPPMPQLPTTPAGPRIPGQLARSQSTSPNTSSNISTGSSISQRKDSLKLTGLSNISSANAGGSSSGSVKFGSPRSAGINSQKGKSDPDSPSVLSPRSAASDSEKPLQSPGGSASVLIPPMSPTSPPPTTSSSSNTSSTSNALHLPIPAIPGGKKFIVWMPNGLKHSAHYNADATIKTYLEKLCRTRDELTPATFIAKDASGKAIDIETSVSKLESPEIWWDTLAPGYKMPSEFAVIVAGGKGVSSLPVPGSHPKSDSLISSKTKSSDKNSKDIVVSAPPPREVASESSELGPAVDHRTKIVREIYTTENSYVESLKLLITFYLRPLTSKDSTISMVSGDKGSNAASSGASVDKDVLVSSDSLSSVGSSSSSTNLSSLQIKSSESGQQLQLPPPDVIKGIFPKNLELILNLNEQIKEVLHAAVIKDGNMDTIGEIFFKYVNFLKMYNEYSSDYQNCLSAYNKLSRDYPSFSIKLDELRAQSGSRLKYEDLIIMPVQRVPRYSLLISDLLKNTPPTHPDYNNLATVVNQLADIGNFINESVRKSDNAKRIQELEAKGANFDKLITPSRFLVREGAVKVVEMKKKETKHFFLFNDVLVSVKDSMLKQGIDLSLPEYVWPLNLVWINENDTAYEIIGPHGATMAMKKKKTTDVTWIKDLNARILSAIQKTFPDVTALGPKRTGSYLSSIDEQYDGEWQDGLKHGNGSSVISGCVYSGTWENGKRHGRGTLIYANGSKFIGEWKNDLPHGQGTLYTSNDDPIYVGSWVNGNCHGSGIMHYYPSGDKYQGDFYEGRCTGQGTYTSKSTSGTNSLKYEGQWKDDQYDGRGVMTIGDKVQYEGQWRSGVRSGKGTLFYPNGSKYNGDFVDGMRHGKGEYTDIADGSVYEGEWVDDRAEGKGIKTWPDKTKYEGSFFRGARKGQGKCLYQDGSRYEGFWMDDKAHGQGTYTFSDASIYVGEWVNGRREGKGTMIYASQAKYEGSWFGDRFHKSGVYQAAPTDYIKLYDGEWIYGRMNNKGTLQFQNGDSFKGNFKDGRPHGAGTYTYTSGATFTGKWNAGIREGKGTYTTVGGDDKKDKDGQNGTMETSANVLNTSAGLPIFLPPQQPLFLITPGIEGYHIFGQ